MHRIVAASRTMTIATAATLFAMRLHAGDLEVVVRGVHSTDGQVLVAVHRESPEAAFPSDASVVASAARAATTDDIVIVFPDLPAGDYAVAAFHDADGDGTLNANFVGMPTEGYGFSNDARGFMGPPTFDAAAIAVGPGAEAARAARAVRTVVTVACRESSE